MVYSTGSTDTPFKFSGFMGVITDGNGLLSMRARFYSPVLARFISMDPAKFEGGLNWYAFANGSPMTLGDPTGLGPRSTLDIIQTGLSVLGMMPGVGFVFDLVNAGISFARGNFGEAALNLFAAIPGIGDAMGGAKIAGAFRMVDEARDFGKAVTTNTSAGLETLSFEYKASKKGLTNAELVNKAGQKAFDKISGKGGVVGTARHEYATKLLERYQGMYGDKGLRFKETVSQFGQKSILDVRDINSKTIYDWKFGNSARMSTSQMNKYQAHYPNHTIQIEKYSYN